jgi:hypothetical protein
MGPICYTMYNSFIQWDSYDKLNNFIRTSCKLGVNMWPELNEH